MLAGVTNRGFNERGGVHDFVSSLGAYILAKVRRRALKGVFESEVPREPMQRLRLLRRQ